jgi:hypothetical protein
MVENLTNQELANLIKDLEEKYGKLLKVANKLAVEMDSLHEQYVEALKEQDKRKKTA